MSRYSLFAAAVVAVTARSTMLPAQTMPVQVHGVAYDSVRGTPLAGALITIAGDARTARTDGRGRFTFDSVVPGVHAFAAQHAALDSLGFSGISARARVTDGRDEVRIASPSFATLWRAVCGTTRVPKDSGFVYGTVRDAVTQVPVPNATIDVTWLDINVDRRRRISQNRYRGQARSDSTGSYEVCGIPAETGTRIRARTDSATSGLIDLAGLAIRVQRRDLMMGPESDSGAVRSGVVSGLVVDSSGRPIADARILADGAAELRSGADGRFLVPALPVGTRQIEVLSIGRSPVVATVDVTPVDTATMLATMRKITTLDIVRVTGSRSVQRLVRDIEDRRKLGSGYMRDSSEIRNHGSLFSVMFEFPGVRVDRRGLAGEFVVTMAGTGADRCLANVVVDGQRSDYDQLNTLRPADIAAIEVYPHRMSLPMQFVRNDDCGVVVVWTKWAFR